MKNMRILIFSATFGAGHVRAAEALIEEMRVQEPEAEIIHMDFGEFISKTINTVIKSTYIEVIKHTPKLWGKFYYRTAKIPPHSVFQRFLNGLGKREFLEYIHSLQPDLIICTYPTVAGVLARLRMKKVLNIPLVTVVTDYAVHSQWIHEGVDLYIVGSQEVSRGLAERGIDPHRIKVTGIPVSPRFEQKIDSGTVRKKLGLNPDIPTCLVMGGAYGVLGGAKFVCKILADTELPVQTIVVCGQDEKLYKSLDSVIEEAKNPVIRFGFVKNVEELMSASDLIITKAGGLTVSEALTKRLPLLIFKPIPGQEGENARYIERIGAGLVADHDEEFEEILFSVLRNPGRINEMRKASILAHPGRAAEKAVEAIRVLTRERKTKQKIG